MSKINFERTTFKVGLMCDHDQFLQNMLREVFPTVSITHYDYMELLLEDIANHAINLVLFLVDNDATDTIYKLDILNEQSISFEIPILVVAPEKLIERSFLNKYNELDFIRKPINSAKLRHRINLYIRFFEKNVVLEKEKALVDKERETLQAIFNVHNGMILLFKEDEIIMINRQFLHFTNYDSFDQFYTYSSKVFKINSGEFSCDDVSEKNIWIDELLRLEPSKRVVIMKNREGVKRSFKVRINKFMLHGEHTLVTFDDITNFYNQAKIYEKYAHYDELTGLANRRKFDEDVQKHIKAHRRHNYDLSLIMLDIDHFKKINDTFGHNEGDNILKLLATVLLEHVRSEDLVVRWGGEEFLILLPFTSLKDAEIVANNLRKSVHLITLEDTTTLSCSFGVAKYYDTLDIKQWIAYADEALYSVKKSGRDGVKVYDKDCEEK